MTDDALERAQLDRIESKLDGLGLWGGTIVPPDERLAPFNRWAAFTDDELYALQHWEDLVTMDRGATTNELERVLRGEIDAELQQRYPPN